jgi:hypothetical protein
VPMMITSKCWACAMGISFNTHQLRVSATSSLAFTRL